MHAVTVVISRKWCQIETLLLQNVAAKVIYSLSFPVTLSDLLDHSHITLLLKCYFSNSCSAVDKISTDIVSLGVSAITELLVIL